MAVDGEDCVPTEYLILSKPRRHFRTTVHALHWQLRSLIGAEGQNIIYYPTGELNKSIQRLNTTTCETETIKRLPFSPRCLVAENGWICCGGEHGEFAAFQVRDESARLHLDGPLAPLNLDPDDRLPLGLLPMDLDLSRPEDAIFLSLARARTNKSMLAESKKFGKQLVNCITLWFPPAMVQLSPGAYTEPIAVLARNDKIVTLLRLRTQDPVEELTFPDLVNRAIISPDGQLLIAITDDPYLYIHARIEKYSSSSGLDRTADWSAYEWSPRGKIRLQSQRKNDSTTLKGSFAACFSGNGKHLAVGTQSGCISVFNAAALAIPGASALITAFSSSRSTSIHGAVRDMAFAPGSMDLLAWTEDRGRVGIADLRSNFVYQQTLKLEDSERFEHVSITDRSTIDPRLLEHRGNDNLSSTFASTLDLSLENRQGNQSADQRVPLSQHYSPLTHEETVVLEALQDQRRRQELRDQREQRAAAQPGTSPALRLPWAAAENTSSARSPRERSASVTRVVNDIMSNIRDQRERVRQTQARAPSSWNDTSNDTPAAAATTTATTTADAMRRTPLVTRGSSRLTMHAAQTGQGMMPPTERRALVSRLAASANATANGNAGANPSGGNANPSVPPPPGGGSSWESIEALYNPTLYTTLNSTATANDSSSPGEPQAQTPAQAHLLTLTQSQLQTQIQARVQLAAIEADVRRRDRAAFLVAEWDETPARRIERYHVNREAAPPHPHNTSGLAWSENGRILYLGADDGIYEFHVDPLRRKLFPSCELR